MHPGPWGGGYTGAGGVHRAPREMDPTAFESLGPGTERIWPSGQSLFSFSYLYLFLNILGIKLILGEYSAVTRGKWACAGPWLLTPLASPHERWLPDALPLPLLQFITRPHPLAARIE